MLAGVGAGLFAYLEEGRQGDGSGNEPALPSPITTCGRNLRSRLPAYCQLFDRRSGR